MNLISSKVIPSLYLAAVISCFSSNIVAIEVYRADLESNGSNFPIDIGLYNDDVKNTVTKLHGYLDAGFFDNLLINRSAPGFVLQGGAFTFNDSLNDGSFSYAGNNQFNGGLQPIISQGTINNEFRHSNTRGTLAMAKINGAPDSATSEWFINLTDNSFLDDDNGGFTVFGEVLAGMSDIDFLATAPIENLKDDIISDSFFIDLNFIEIPLQNYTDTSILADIEKKDLIIINDFTPLFQLTNVVEFTDVNDQSEKDVIIRNNNITPLTLGAIDTSSVLPPFSITENLCDNQTLLMGQQCVIKTTFSTPTNTADYFHNVFNITVNPYGYDIPVTLKIPSPKVSIEPTEIDFGFVPIYNPDDGTPEFAIVRIKNSGDKDLGVKSVEFNTVTPAEFEFFDNCTSTNNDYKPGFVRIKGLCFLVMQFRPIDLDIKTAEITIVTNDPVNGVITVPITYGATTDTDGINRDIEIAAPNNGDGNNDDSPDHLQSNVASFNYQNSPYITLVTDKELQFNKVISSTPPSLSTLPDGTTLGYGIFNFELTNVSIGGLAEFGIILQKGESPSDIYVYSPSINDTNDHWYKLEKDTTPGVVKIGNASIISPSEHSIDRNITIASIVDGGLGDADMTANGTIIFNGGPAISEDYNSKSSSSGSNSWATIAVLFMITLIRRVHTQSKSRNKPGNFISRFKP